MEIGDKVKAKHNSYSLTVANDVVNGFLKRGYPGGQGRMPKDSPILEIVDTKLKLPSTKTLSENGESNQWNDTIIKNIENGETYFIQSRFLVKVEQSPKDELYNATETLKENLEKNELTYGNIANSLTAISDFLLENN